MKGFERKNPLFSLCGLNCGLCSMHLGGHCAGCGYGNASCKIARCSMEHGRPEYCFQCAEYPCPKYEAIDAYDSFITHKNQKADLQKAARIGIDAYNAEQTEKVGLLNELLSRYNAGREKTLYCLAVNLLAAEEIKGVLEKAESAPGWSELPLKEQAASIAGLLRELAEKKHIELKLRKK
jgi:hypothetical protein